MTFGTRLRQARTRKELSGDALGKLLSPPATRQNVSHWETDRHPPSLPQFARLCEILGVSADWLLLGVPAIRADQLPWVSEAPETHTKVRPPPATEEQTPKGPRRAISRAAYDRRVPPHKPVAKKRSK